MCLTTQTPAAPHSPQQQQEWARPWVQRYNLTYSHTHLQFYAQIALLYRRLIHAIKPFSPTFHSASLLLLTLLTAANCYSQPDEGEAQTSADDSVANDTRVIQRTVPAPEQEWMQAYMGDENSNNASNNIISNKDAGAMWLGEGNEAFIGLFNPAATPYQMSVLLLSSKPSELTQTNIFRQLYLDLPLYGWSTLNILLPATLLTPELPERVIGPGGLMPTSANNEAETPDKASESTAAAPPSEGDAATTNIAPPSATDIAAQRIQAGNQWLLDKGAGSLTIIADENTLQWAIDASIANTATTSGLVLWKLALDELNAGALTALRESRVSILDVISEQSKPRELLERKQTFARAGFTNDYRYIIVPAGDVDITYTHTSKRIRHWLNTEFKKF